MSPEKIFSSVSVSSLSPCLFFFFFLFFLFFFQYVKAAEALALLPSSERNTFPSLLPSFFLPGGSSLLSLSSTAGDISSSSSYPSLLSMTVEACYRLCEVLEERKIKKKMRRSLLYEKKNSFSKTDIRPLRSPVRDSVNASSSLSLPSFSSDEEEVREEIFPIPDDEDGVSFQDSSSLLCLRERERNEFNHVSSLQQDLSEMAVAHAAKFLLFQLQSWEEEVLRSLELLEEEDEGNKEAKEERGEAMQKGKEVSKIENRRKVRGALSPAHSLSSGEYTDERFDLTKEEKKKFFETSLEYLRKQVRVLKERLDHLEFKTCLDLLPERERRERRKDSSFSTSPVLESDKQDKRAAGGEPGGQTRQEGEATKRKEDKEMRRRERESEEEEDTVLSSLSIPSTDRGDRLFSSVEGHSRKSMIDVYREKKLKDFDLHVKNLDEVLKLLEEEERSLLSPLHQHEEKKEKRASMHHQHPRSLLRRIRQSRDLKSILPLIHLYLASSSSSGLSRLSTLNSKEEEEGLDETARKRRRKRRENEDEEEQDKVVQLHHIMVELLRVLHEENRISSPSSSCRSSCLIDGEDKGGVCEKGGQEGQQDGSPKISRGEGEKKNNHREREEKDCSTVPRDAFLKIFDQLLLSLLPSTSRHPSSSSSSLQTMTDQSLRPLSSPSPHQGSVYTPQHHVSYSYVSTAISLALMNDFHRLQHFLSSLSSSSSAHHLPHHTISSSSFPLHLLPSIAGITALLFQLMNPRRDTSTSMETEEEGGEEEDRRKENEKRLLMHAMYLIERTSPQLLHLSLEHHQSLPQSLQFLLAHIKSLQGKRQEEEERKRQMPSSLSSFPPDQRRNPSVMKFTRHPVLDEPSLHAQKTSSSTSSQTSSSIQLTPISSFSSDTENNRSSSLPSSSVDLSTASSFSSSVYEEVEDTPALHAARSAISSLYVRGPEELVKEILEAFKKRQFSRVKEDPKVFSKILELILLVRCETRKLVKIVQKNTEREEEVAEGQAEGEREQTDEDRSKTARQARSSSSFIHPVLWRERKRIIRLYTQVSSRHA